MRVSIHALRNILNRFGAVLSVIKPYPSSEKDQRYSAFSYSANTPLSLTHTVPFSSTSKSLPTDFLNSLHYPQVPPIAQVQLRQERTHAVADFQLSGVDCLKNMHIFIHHLSDLKEQVIAILTLQPVTHARSFDALFSPPQIPQNTIENQLPLTG